MSPDLSDDVPSIRDDMTSERLAHVDDAFKLYRCKTIMNW